VTSDLVQQGEPEDDDGLDNNKTSFIIQDDEMKTHAALAKCLHRLCRVLTLVTLLHRASLCPGKHFFHLYGN